MVQKENLLKSPIFTISMRGKSAGTAFRINGLKLPAKNHLSFRKSIPSMYQKRFYLSI